jgi:hypothetical protein
MKNPSLQYIEAFFKKKKKKKKKRKEKKRKTSQAFLFMEERSRSTFVYD